MSTNIQLIVSAIMLAAAGISYLLYKCVAKKHAKDPIYQEEKRRKEEELKKRLQESESLQDFDLSTGYEDYAPDTFQVNEKID